MPYRQIYRLLALAVSLSSGCALAPHEELDVAPVSTEEDPELTYLECTAGRCRGPITRASPEQEAINAKIRSLDALTRQTYFHHALTNDAFTPDGTPYQFWTDASGVNLGAIYVVDGTAIAIRGAFLEYWARGGYENSLMGYPRGDEVDGRQEFETQWVVPEVENQGLSARRQYLVYEGGAVHRHFENWYLDSNLPHGQLSPEPQQCDVREVTALQGSALEALLDDPKYGGVIVTLWCGEPPGPWVPPQNAEIGDI